MYSSVSDLSDPIEIEDIKIDCLKDNHGNPIITCTQSNRQFTYTDIYSLIKKVPKLLEKKQLTKLAEVVNFMVKGDEFTVIKNPETFLKDYKDQLDKEKQSFDQHSLLPYGEYNIDEVSHPHIEEGDPDRLIFYVKKKIPFKVSCSLPIDEPFPNITYEVLATV